MPNEWNWLPAALKKKKISQTPEFFGHFEGRKLLPPPLFIRAQSQVLPIRVVPLTLSLFVLEAKLKTWHRPVKLFYGLCECNIWTEVLEILKTIASVL